MSKPKKKLVPSPREPGEPLEEPLFKWAKENATRPPPSAEKDVPKPKHTVIDTPSGQTFVGLEPNDEREDDLPAGAYWKRRK